jgi:RNA 3'-terminal phosphate cyclase-like protein
MPESIGKRCALRLLNELQFSGFVDSNNQSLIFLLMALSEKTISKVKIGRLTAYSVETIRTLRDFLGVTF